MNKQLQDFLDNDTNIDTIDKLLNFFTEEEIDSCNLWDKFFIYLNPNKEYDFINLVNKLINIRFKNYLKNSLPNYKYYSNLISKLGMNEDDGLFWWDEPKEFLQLCKKLIKNKNNIYSDNFLIKITEEINLVPKLVDCFIEENKNIFKLLNYEIEEIKEENE